MDQEAHQVLQAEVFDETLIYVPLILYSQDPRSAAFRYGGLNPCLQIFSWVMAVDHYCQLLETVINHACILYFYIALLIH